MQTTGADFAISYRYIYRDPETFLESLSEEEREAYVKSKIVMKQESVIESWVFWVLVLAGLCGVAIMIVFCICFVNMKKENDEIIAKVFMMTEQ